MATNDDLQTALREASHLIRGGRFLVIGSQSLLGSLKHDDLPAAATASLEFDIAVFGDVDSQAADRIDGVLGEWSDFHDEHGFYVQGVDVDTAVLPDGWQGRTVRVPIDDESEIDAVCLEPHDTCAAKLARNEDRDRSFVGALVDAGLIDPSLLAQRIRETPDDRLEMARKSVVLAFVRSLGPR